MSKMSGIAGSRDCGTARQTGTGSEQAEYLPTIAAIRSV